jgi:predicted peptidase
MPALRLVALLLTALALPACSSTMTRPAAATPASAGFHERTITIGGTLHRYVVYIPRATPPPAPVIMFLHGRGECGSDAWKPVSQGIGRAIMNDAARWPFVVIFPQKPDPQRQWEEYTPLVMGTLNAVRNDLPTDPARTYLTGLSQGGHGTWAIAAANPTIWAAIAPICGYGDPATLAPPLAAMPIWCFHGDADPVIKVEQTRAMVQALRAAHAPNLIATEYPGVDHNSWDRAYAEPELPAWFLKWRRPHTP